MGDDLIKFRACRGRGYFRCECWPGDCICGRDDEDCEQCDGTGWLYPDGGYPDYDDPNMTMRPSDIRKAE